MLRFDVWHQCEPGLLSLACKNINALIAMLIYIKLLIIRQFSITQRTKALGASLARLADPQVTPR